MKKTIYIFILLVVMMGILEAGLQVANFIISSGEEENIGDKFYLLSPYEGKDWAKEMYKEYDELTGGYKEFRGWGKNEYHGKYVNIDAYGVRKTWNPEDFGEKKPETLYVFGPSNIWGYGARDDYTIPSFISKMLNGKNYNLEVYNFGEFAYTYAQEIITLVLLLKEGHRPDYVISYDGINDVYSAYQAGKPGVLSNQFLIHKRLEKMDLSNTGHIKAVFNNILENYSKIYMGFKKMEELINPPESGFQEVAHSYDDSELKGHS